MPKRYSLVPPGGVRTGSRIASRCSIRPHVCLETSEDDATAQEMLDISEQTFFLHAFCRADLKTELKAVRV